MALLVKEAAGRGTDSEESSKGEAPLAVSLLSKENRAPSHFLGAKHVHLLPEGV